MTPLGAIRTSERARSDHAAGGNVESQRDLLEALSNSDSRRALDRLSGKTPPVANNFALGYTYYDVLDSDQEGGSSGSCRATTCELRLTDGRHHCSRLPLPPRQSVSLIRVARRALINAAVDTEYPTRYPTRLVGAVAVDAATPGLAAILPYSSSVPRRQVQGCHVGNHDVVEG